MDGSGAGNLLYDMASVFVPIYLLICIYKIIDMSRFIILASAYMTSRSKTGNGFVFYFVIITASVLIVGLFLPIPIIAREGVGFFIPLKRENVLRDLGDRMG